MAPKLSIKRKNPMAIPRASGTITVGKKVQTCWFCSARGHILTAGHIFFEQGAKGGLEASAKKGDSFQVEFQDQKVKQEAELLEEPYLDSKTHLDFAILRLKEPPDQDIKFLPICAHEDCRSAGMSFVFSGIRQVTGEWLTDIEGTLTKEMAISGAVCLFQVTRIHHSDVSGLSGAAARAVCKETDQISAMGIQVLQAEKAGEELFVVPSARLIATSPTLQALCNPNFWTTREERLLLLCELRDAIKKGESTGTPWEPTDQHLADVFGSNYEHCAEGAITCPTCLRCVFGFLGEPEPKRLIQAIERGHNVIMLYGSKSSGKTNSGKSLYVAKARNPIAIGEKIKFAIVETKLILKRLKEEQKAKGPSTFLRQFAIEMLHEVAKKLAAQSHKFHQISDRERREWCEARITHYFNVLGIADVVGGDLLPALKAVLRGIVPADLGLTGDVRIVVLLEDAHRIDEYQQELAFRPGEQLWLPVNALLTAVNNPSFPTPSKSEDDEGAEVDLANRHLVITTRQVREIVTLQHKSRPSSHDFVVLPISDVAYLDAHRIAACLSSRNSPRPTPEDWSDIAWEIQRLTDGYPWYVHKFLLFLDCILKNVPALNPMKAVWTVAAARFLWTYQDPLKTRRGCLEQIEIEIECLENDERYDPNPGELNPLAKSLDKRAKSGLGIIPISSLTNPRPGYTSRRTSVDVERILPAVQVGLLADRKEVDSWRYANMIVEMHFPVESQKNEAVHFGHAAQEGTEL